MAQKKSPAIPYTLIDHTADIGIHVFGEDIRQLFAHAALAMFDLIGPLRTIKGDHRLTVEIQGEDKPELLVNWLRELLYLWNGEEKLVGRIPEIDISGNHLTATLAYDDFDPDLHVIVHEIKAVTFHQAEVKQGKSCWEALVILDT
ncbi:MAG: archease [Desulfobacteraceae bacterium]|nr:archease [Desulfobacteraceae bacterium]